MANKTLILSQKQLNEIVDEEWNVNANSLSDSSDAELGSLQVTANDGFSDNVLPEPTTTDRIAHDLNVSDISAGLWKNGGVNGAVYSLREWKKKRLTETNQDLNGQNFTFSPTEMKNIGNSAPKSSAVGKAMQFGGEKSRLADIVHDFKDAMEKAKNGDRSTLDRMGGEAAYDAANAEYEKAKKQTQNLRNSRPEGSKLKQKRVNNSGNGQGHDMGKANNGTITWS